MTGFSTSRTFKLTLLGSIAALSLPGIALAQDTTISSEQTTPVLTSASGNVTIDAAGSVTVDSGVAVTIDSDNTVNNAGTVTGGTGDGVTGVLVTGDRAFGYTQSGTIDLRDTSLTVVVDDPTNQANGTQDDETPPDFANDRFGFRIAAGTYTGDVSFASGAQILVDGDQSKAFSAEGDLDGSIDFGGGVILRGANSVGVDISGNVGGDVSTGATSSLRITGVNSDALAVSGDVGGSVTVQGTMIVTGYEDLSPDDETDDPNTSADDAIVAAAIAENNIQKGLTSGHAINLSGSVANGVIIEGDVSSEFDRISVTNNDDGSTTTARTGTSGASVSVFGSGQALRIDGGIGGLVIGQADTSDVIDARQVIDGNGVLTNTCQDTDGNDVTCTSYGTYGLINRGTLVTDGVYEGVNATTAYIANATITDGIRNEGSIDARASDAIARGLVFGASASSPVLDSFGRISATAQGTTAEAAALTIEAGATLPAVNNYSRIEAGTTSDNGVSVGIRDRSGTVTAFNNFGIVETQQRNSSLTPDVSAAPQTIAMDFSANTNGITIRNTTPDSFDPNGSVARSIFGVVVGDVLTGSGDDIYYADAGSTTGNISLGAGNDRLDLSQGTQVTGNVDFGAGDGTLLMDNASLIGDMTFGTGTHTLALSGGSVARGVLSTMGTTNIDIVGSSLLLENSNTLNIGTLNIAADGETGGVLGIAVSEDGATLGRLNASSITIADGTEIRTLFTKAFADFANGTDTLEQVILSSANTAVNVDTLLLNVGGNTPVLFEQGIRQDGTDVILSLRRKSASELGLGKGMEAAFDPVIVALTQDQALGAALFNTTTTAEFQAAFNQVVAGPLDAPLAYARAQNSSLTSLISQRIEMLGDQGDLARTAWIQQQSYFIDRKSSADSNGFDGGGFVIAAGADTPVGGLDVLGVAIHMASARYDEQLGDDFPFNRLSYGADIYAAEDFGAVEVDGRVGFATASSDSERNVVFGGERRQLTAKWDGTQVSANGRIRYRRALGEKFELVPFASVDYVKLKEDAYTEAGDAILALDVSARDATSVRGNVGVSLGKPISLRPSAYDTGIPGTLTPRLTMAYSHEFSQDDIKATYNFNGGEDFTLLSAPESGAAVIGADVDYENQYAKVSLGASGTFGDQITAYTLRVGVGLKW